MLDSIVSSEKLKAIADAIRWKRHNSTQLKLDQMPNEILNIESPMDDIRITHNDTYMPNAYGVEGFNKVVVDVPDVNHYVREIKISVVPYEVIS